MGAAAQRIQALVAGQLDLVADGLDRGWEALARQYAARILSRRGAAATPRAGEAPPSDYQRVDLERVEVLRPRSVGAEHVALEALRRLGLDVKLAELGFNRHQLNTAIGAIVARMVHPGSELATHRWLGQRSGLGELLDYDFAALDLSRLYRASDRLLAHRATLEAFLYARECDLLRPDRDHHPLRPDQHLLRGHRPGQSQGRPGSLQGEAHGLSAGHPGPGARRQRFSQA